MDVAKWKWMAAERLKKAGYRIQLAYYEAVSKGKMAGDDGLYYHLKKSTLKSLLEADPEQEYLITHGLWKDPEIEMEPETESEAEPGLLRELGLIELLPKAVIQGERSYHLSEVKEYTDHVCLTLCIMGETQREETLAISRAANERCTCFTMDGREWRWDSADAALRVIPRFDSAAGKELAPHIRLVDGQVLRLEKAYAEEQLSQRCLDYAFSSKENGYSWCIADRSACPVFYELADVFFGGAETEKALENQSELLFFCPSYWGQS